MKSLKTIISEKLIINKNTKIYNIFSDEELRKDYKEVAETTTKLEKTKFADKYGITDLKIRSIQIEILNILRNNRNNKKEFTKNDVIDFISYDISENKYIDYLDQESKDFVEYLLDWYYNKAMKLQCVRKYGLSGQFNSYNSSVADRYIIKKYRQIQKYLLNKK